jgi:hypothetical protein
VQWCSASAQTSEASNAVAAAVTANSTAVTVHTHEVPTLLLTCALFIAVQCSIVHMMRPYALLPCTGFSYVLNVEVQCNICSGPYSFLAHTTMIMCMLYCALTGRARAALECSTELTDIMGLSNDVIINSNWRVTRPYTCTG